MWSSSRRRVCQALLAAALVPGAAACGLRPLYLAGAETKGETGELLADTRIQPISGRIGQKLHNFLRDRINPAGQPTRPSYELDIKVSTRTRELGVRKDETATRANLTINAVFSLRSLEAGRVVLAGRSSSVNSYNILDDFYATTVSENDAIERGLREVAEDIRLRLAVYFADPEVASVR